MDFAFGASQEEKSDQVLQEESKVYFPIPTTKLILLILGTLGFYTIYWFYKNWKYIKVRESDRSIMPFWRGVFAIFFTHRLFGDIEREASKQGLLKDWNAETNATIYVIVAIVGRIIDRISWRFPENKILSIASIVFLIFTIFPIHSVQRTINELNKNYFEEVKPKFHPFEIAIIVIGSIFWLLIAIGLFLPEVPAE
ncbi:hypothetical protein [Leptospira sarikeiensis]|uniref:DUF4234 domain-containing protein n=1 Tax=Leptospira sarikeiensis TaxID=2484943 RepID=A0A4R9K1R3_9LEPT|nr:hypothetical protein [Leptospira sarikeiensis]TGL58760.1 hypothetical protein EHQ64_17070 [Leptospira sarikeiensis]